MAGQIWSFVKQAKGFLTIRKCGRVRLRVYVAQPQSRCLAR
jgi:hypothetical protein